jgi:hypothetical protein
VHRSADQEFRLVRGGKPATTVDHLDIDRGPDRARHLRSVDPTPPSPGDEPVQLTALP